jgi:hypothetical protein
MHACYIEEKIKSKVIYSFTANSIITRAKRRIEDEMENNLKKMAIKL